jgi:hypothetical protein
MRILVSDTSVLIDLERGNLLDSCFKLPLVVAVPDLLYSRELADYGGAALVARGLRVEGLTGDEVAFAQKTRGDHPKLFLPDAFAYTLASERGWTLLTGDGELRALAQAEKVPLFGVLWLLDQLFDGQVIEASALVAGLEVIAAHPRCRLPRAEIQARLDRYDKAKERN